MIINPRIAIANGWIKNIKDESKQVQPNGIDFTLDTLKVLSQDTAKISESDKVMRSLQDYPHHALSYDRSHWFLEAQRVYDGTSDVYVEVPQGVATLLYTRSTFVRNGIFIVSGLYDSGYKGHIGFTIYTLGGAAHVEKGVRVGQIVFVKADSAGAYAGQWNHQQGTHYREPPQPTGLGGPQEPSGEVFGARGQSKTFL